MKQLIESLRRLYGVDKIDKNQLDKLLMSKKINQQEYDYIISAKEVV